MLLAKGSNVLSCVERMDFNLVHGRGDSRVAI
jgi:hypothetical protein